MDLVTLAIAKKFTKDTVVGLGAIKGASCRIKSVTKNNGQNTVVFEWEGTDGTIQTSEMKVDDGTPIYVWESGNSYEYGDLVIYSSQWYRCITPNHDVEFDSNKWNEIGSPDGNYDIVNTVDELPSRFTSADRKMYFVVNETSFYYWDGYEWEKQTDVISIEEIDELFDDE